MGRKIFNYNQISKQKYEINNNKCICNSEDYKKYINNDFGHIVTGDLNIINHEQLKNIMSYGTKYRIPTYSTIKKILQQLHHDLDYFIYKVAIKNNQTIELFNEWKFTLLEKFKLALNKNKYNIQRVNSFNINKPIADLQKNFVITYVDKAPNNYAIICKSFYKYKLNECILHNNYFKKHSNNLEINNKKIFNYHKLLKLDHSNFKYPYMVLIPKFHKCPLNFRTVTIGCNAYNNHAAQKLFIILNHIKENIKNNPSNIIVSNSHDLKNILIKLKNVTALATYDFKDLFNNISINDLQSVILTLYKDIQPCIINNDTITIDYLKTLTNYLIKNNYILYQDNFYIQLQGIPQGGKNSSILADLYLFYYETKHNYNQYYTIFRYIDDILIVNLNDNNTFPIKYPNMLELVKGNSDNKIANFLDLSLHINNKKIIEIDIYDKRSAFTFNVNTLTYFHSCVHTSVFKNIIINHLIRIKNLTTSKYKNKNLKILKRRLTAYKYPSHYIKNFITGFLLVRCIFQFLKI